MNTNRRQAFQRGWMGVLAVALAVAGMTASVRAADEAVLREQFMKAYWSVVTNERMFALDLLASPSEGDSIWMLFTVSYWDPETQVREKAFRLLSQLPDEQGTIAGLCGQSFNLDKDIDVKVQKAKYMKNLRYRYPVLETLVNFVLKKQPGNKLGWPYGGWGGWHGWGGYGWHGGHGWHGGGRGLPGVGRCGLGFGFGGWGVIDGEVMRDDRERFQGILDTINYFGGADFKARRGVEREIESWWEMKQPEIRELDRREREKALPAQPKASAPGAKDPLQIKPRITYPELEELEP
ncbi:MAG: hypothetical protein HS116_23415 [Planctomycetes bacterium]|nr:hypothetical protein [Planctomycetota bacterium]